MMLQVGPSSGVVLLTPSSSTVVSEWSSSGPLKRASRTSHLQEICKKVLSFRLSHEKLGQEAKKMSGRVSDATSEEEFKHDKPPMLSTRGRIRNSHREIKLRRPCSQATRSSAGGFRQARRSADAKMDLLIGIFCQTREHRVQSITGLGGSQSIVYAFTSIIPTSTNQMRC